MNWINKFFKRRRLSQYRVAGQATIDLVSASGLFDATWYVESYPEVSTRPESPLLHFCQRGMYEHKDPGPNFSTIKYLSMVPAAARLDIAPFMHAMYENPRSTGHGLWVPDDLESFIELIHRSGLFNEQWYLSRYPDIARAKILPIRHFAEYGAAECRNPSSAFDSEHYANCYPHYSETYRSPIEHFIRIGRQQGYDATGLPEYERWVTAYDTLTDEDLQRIHKDFNQASLPPVVIFHVLGTQDCDRINQIFEAVIAQIGSRPVLHFVRASEVPDDIWVNCLSRTPAGSCIQGKDALEVLQNLVVGTVVILCGGAVLLRQHSTYMFANVLTRLNAMAAYADHDWLAADGTRIAPTFKPDMSPEFMANLPYADRVAAIVLSDENRSSVVAAVSGALDGEAETQWASLYLGLPTGRVAHIPFVLFHRLGNVPANASATCEPVAAPSALNGAKQSQMLRSGGATTIYSVPTSVRIIIPTRDRMALLRACIDSIVADTDYTAGAYEIVIVNNESAEDETHAYLSEARKIMNLTVVSSAGSFNFSKICNDGAADATQDVLVFLNNDMTVNRADWLSKIVAFAMHPDVGVVGAQLLYPNDTVQHGGVVLGVQGVGAHRLVREEASTVRDTDVTREMIAVTGACLAIRRELFVHLGGFDPALAVAFNDVQLCASAYEAGYRNIYIAEPLFYHHESQSRGYDDTPEKLARNHREAIYVRERHAKIFQNDPSYNPNLSIQKIGAFALPPRVVRPWRRSSAGRKRILLLSCVHAIGHGVPLVVSQQAQFLCKRGWEVIVGGPETDNDIVYYDCRRVTLSTAQQASEFAVREGIDCVVVHTPPFFSIVRFLGKRPLVYFVDHGEPPPSFFPDRDERENIIWEKRFCTPLAKRTFVISQAIYDQQFRIDAVVARNGNTHLATWSEAWAERRPALRRKLSFDGRFVILNVSRFETGDQFYKGIERYVRVALEAPFAQRGLKERIIFVLAGRGYQADVDYIRSLGLIVFANPTDAEIADLYAASDLYLNLSQWEGYNLGIGQARAMGLDVLASNIDAHREFGIETSDSIPKLCAMVAKHHEVWDEAADDRTAFVEPWNVPLTRFAELVEADLTEDVVGDWF